MSGPRSYTSNTIKRLFALSGNQCAFPSCDQKLVNENNAANSNICHIEAAESGGQRYNENMTNTQRADYSNLILLCPSHHVVTNDETIYTVDKLKAMKTEHEAIMSQRCKAERPLNTRPSLLTDVIKEICKVDLDQVIDQAVSHAFNIDNKIKYNNVTRFRPFIQEHAEYAGKLQKIYTEFERSGKGKMNAVLRNIASIYAKQKGSILEDDGSITNIQKNSDNLIEAVLRDLHDLIECSPNNDNSLSYEEVEFALSIILVDAFMRCKILEEPK